MSLGAFVDNTPNKVRDLCENYVDHMKEKFVERRRVDFRAKVLKSLDFRDIPGIGKKKNEALKNVLSELCDNYRDKAELSISGFLHFMKEVEVVSPWGDNDWKTTPEILFADCSIGNKTVEKVRKFNEDEDIDEKLEENAKDLTPEFFGLNE